MSWSRISAVVAACWLCVAGYGVRHWLLHADREGGPTLVYQIDAAHAFDKSLSPSQLGGRTLASLKARLERLAPGAEVQAEGMRLQVRLPRRTNLALVRAVLSRPARLELKLVDDGSKFMDELGRRVKESGEQRLLVLVREDAWAGPSGGAAHHDSYLAASDETVMGRALQSLAVKPPEDHELALEKVQAHEWRSYYLFRHAELSNDDIAEAQLMWDRVTGRPEVSVAFTKEGGERFAQLTGGNVGRKLAILLDGRIESAPVIQSRVDGGRASINMGGLAEREELAAEARDLVAVLRAGSLPAPLRLVEER